LTPCYRITIKSIL